MIISDKKFYITYILNKRICQNIMCPYFLLYNVIVKTKIDSTFVNGA